MILDQSVTVPAPPEKVWDFLMDVPAVSQCVPGVERVEEIGEDTYEGALKAKVGPITVRLEGKVVLAEKNRDEWQAQMDIDATDRRIRGAVNAKSTMNLDPQDDGSTELKIHTDAAVLGKLGEFGQAVMRRKADQIMAQFAQNMAREIESQG